MKRLTASYSFTKKCSQDGQDIDVFVTLTIDFIHNTYSILPFNGGNGYFQFTRSRNPQLWKAVLELINEAIYFAEKELEGNQ